MINSTVFIFFTFNVLCLKISSIACKFLYITTHNCIDAVTMIVSVYQQQNQSINIVMAHSLTYQNTSCMKMIFMTACIPLSYFKKWFDLVNKSSSIAISGIISFVETSYQCALPHLIVLISVPTTSTERVREHYSFLPLSRLSLLLISCTLQQQNNASNCPCLVICHIESHSGLLHCHIAYKYLLHVSTCIKFMCTACIFGTEFCRDSAIFVKFVLAAT